jgi:5'-deoxynucleotidase YfbR-like HD superfamily hydrolase
MNAVAGVVPTALLAEIGDLKRIRTADAPGSLAERGFLRAWGALLAGADVRQLALHETGRALAATRLAGIDARVLRDGGLSAERAAAVISQTVRQVAARAHPAIGEATASAVGDEQAGCDPPAFASRLCAQPRAGATAPGRPRLQLEPAESHGDHCFVVAIYAVLLAADHDADPARCFLSGLSHHLHNACLPDAGFAGEQQLGADLEPVADAFREHALEQLPLGLRERVRAAAKHALEIATPEGRAVVAADVLDRVLQMQHHARAAAFDICQALDELELVHPGPLQAYGNETLDAAGLP